MTKQVIFAPDQGKNSGAISRALRIPAINHVAFRQQIDHIAKHTY